jgi:hypothetical protein
MQDGDTATSTSSSFRDICHAWPTQPAEESLTWVASSKAVDPQVLSRHHSGSAEDFHEHSQEASRNNSLS